MLKLTLLVIGRICCPFSLSVISIAAVDRVRLMTCPDARVFSNPGMRENDMRDMRHRVKDTLAARRRVYRISEPEMEISAVLRNSLLF